MNDVIRIGFISTVDRIHGTAQVYYPDLGSTTEQLHLFAFQKEFAVPEIGAQVVVLHLPNDTSSGVILGRFWGEADPPPADVLYQRTLAAQTVETVHDAGYCLSAPEITWSGNAGSITLAELIELQKRVAALEEGD